MSNEPPESQRPADGLKLHHIGFVVYSIQECAESFALSPGTTWDGNVVFDPLLRLRVTFCQGRKPIRASIELVEAADRNDQRRDCCNVEGWPHHLWHE